mmetsp:Transcript_11401/g.14844  ORF Transcript_11401/g.14844 Transcript_11401/m.14844 type:complete len:562 (+) Transcript_11401:134-1819(+)
MGKKSKGAKQISYPGFQLNSTSKFSVWEPVSSSNAQKQSKVKETKKQQAITTPKKNTDQTILNDDLIKVEVELLGALSSADSIPDTWDFSQANGWDHADVVGKLKSLEAELMLISEPLSLSYFVLTDEAKGVAERGSPECLLFNALPSKGEGGATLGDLEGKIGKMAAKVGMGPCMKNKWVKKDGQQLVRLVDSVVDETQTKLQQLQAADIHNQGLSNDDIKNLKRRKLVNQVTRKSFKVLKGPEWAPARMKRAGDLTKEMLDSGEWKTAIFKEQNFNTLGAPVGGGYLHPLLKVRTEFRKILMEMGFEEMPTQKWVEGCFWNFDALFQPQSHPARDAHDTFFIKEPMYTNTVPEDYYERVREVHEHGGFGSIGYGCDFKREEAMKNILRTHTTAVSSQMLYQLANQEGGFQPRKYFSIDRVFRNESMDATHLCEFHQVEGLVADRDLSLANLIGVIKTFFEKIGITKLRFKPAYNPYTEPSMEIFGFHPDLKCWTEIGNSGMFRPEMLRPMGLPEDVRVIAWGLSLERPTMIKYNISNIRDLFGHKVDIGQTKMAPICRF